MNKRRIIFFAVFGGYHLIVVIFTLFMEARQKDLSVLLGLFDKITYFKYGAFLGLILVIVDFIWLWTETKQTTRKHEELRLENNTMKAKVYDQQEAEKKKAAGTQPVK